jgi:hypothetical protein
MKKINNKQAARLFWLAGISIIVLCLFAFLVYEKIAWVFVLFGAFACFIAAEYYVSLILKQPTTSVSVIKPEIKLGKIYLLLYFIKKDHMVDAVLKYDDIDGSDTVEVFKDVKFVVDPAIFELNTLLACCLVDGIPKLNRVQKF